VSGRTAEKRRMRSGLSFGSIDGGREGGRGGRKVHEQQQQQLASSFYEKEPVRQEQEQSKRDREEAYSGGRAKQRKENPMRGVEEASRSSERGGCDMPLFPSLLQDRLNGTHEKRRRRK